MGTNTPKNRQSSERPDMHAKFEQIYNPERIATTALDTKVKGKLGSKGKSYSITIKGEPDKATAREGYAAVSGEYRRSIESALNKEDIPPAYRGQVKGYFESLK